MNPFDILKDLGFSQVNSGNWKFADGKTDATCKWFKSKYTMNGENIDIFIDATSKYFTLSFEHPANTVEESFLITFQPTIKEFIKAFSKLSYQLGDENRLRKVRESLEIRP